MKIATVCLKRLKKKTVITEKEKNYFKFNFKLATNVGKLYLLLKIHKRLSNLLRYFELWYPQRKSFGILRPLFAANNERRKPVDKRYSWFSRQPLGEIPEGAVLVIPDVVGLNPSIFHTEGLEVLRKQYGKFLRQKVLTEDVIKMTDFVLKNNFFVFNSTFLQQTFGTAIGTKFAPSPYACIFVDYIETEFALREKTLCKVPCKGP